MLRCPNCHEEHQTLRTLLTCCPQSLRRLTTKLATSSVAWTDCVQQLSGRPLPPLLTRAMADVVPTTEEVA